MTNTDDRTILLVGFSDDIHDLASLLRATSVNVALVNENATDAAIPKAVDLVLYVMSQDTGFSSQLHSRFVYIHDRVLKKAEYLMAIHNVDLDKIAFPELSHLPHITMNELRTLLNSRAEFA